MFKMDRWCWLVHLNLSNHKLKHSMWEPSKPLQKEITAWILTPHMIVSITAHSWRLRKETCNRILGGRFHILHKGLHSGWPRVVIAIQLVQPSSLSNTIRGIWLEKCFFSYRVGRSAKGGVLKVRLESLLSFGLSLENSSWINKPV